MSDHLAAHAAAVQRIIGMLNRAATETCDPNSDLHANALGLATAEIERLQTALHIVHSLLDTRTKPLVIEFHRTCPTCNATEMDHG